MNTSSNDGVSVWKRRRRSNKEIWSNEKKKKNSSKKKIQKEYPLLRYDELPEYMKDNEFILNYYRSDWPLKQAFFSLFHWHNETLNVWT